MLVPFLVSLQVILLRMLTSIDLDRQMRTWRKEVYDIPANGLLPIELHTLQLLTTQT
jgi:hypothetical protein